MKFRIFRRNRIPTPEEQLERIRRDSRFLGVQIHNAGCRASALRAGKIYSKRHVPALPLPGCTAETCRCTYLGVTERRTGLDRRVRPDRRKKPRLQLDRRIGRDRRRGKDIWRGHDQ